MGEKIERMLREADAKVKARKDAEPLRKPRDTHCTGCNEKLTEDYPADESCDECGYMACESCSCHHSRGTVLIVTSIMPSAAG